MHQRKFPGIFHITEGEYSQYGDPVSSASYCSRSQGSSSRKTINISDFGDHPAMIHTSFSRPRRQPTSVLEGAFDVVGGDSKMSNALRKNKSKDLSSLRSDVTYLFDVVNLQAKKLDLLLEQHGLGKESTRLLEVQHTVGRVGESEASLLRHDVDLLTEVVTKQGVQLDWLMSGAMPRPDTGYRPTDPSPVAEKVLNSQPDIIADVLAFCPSNEFLFLAGVSKVWKGAWINTDKPKQTSVHLGAAFLLGKAAWVVYDPSFEQAASRHGGMACLAAKVGNFEGLKVVLNVRGIQNQSPESALQLTRYAARSGNLEVLLWLRARGCPWDSQTTLAAAESGHLEVLQWAKTKGCRLHKDVCSSAARGGHLSVIKWVYSLGFRLDKGVCEAAAREGHLHVVSWYREQGCHWDKNTTLAASAGGHLDVLMWARQHCCPWDKEACAEAASVGEHRKVVDWVLEQKP